MNTGSTLRLSRPHTVPDAMSSCCFASVAALQAKAPGNLFQMDLSFFSLSNKPTLSMNSPLELLEDAEVVDE